MSRFRRSFWGIFSSYLLLAATAVYSLASVPVAVHYLSKLDQGHWGRFGLWVVMGTLANYLNLIDAGISGAVVRLLIDHKDDRAAGKYGSFIKTGWLVSVLQGAVVWSIGILFAPTFARWLAIPANLVPEFIQLVHWQCGVLALSFAMRTLVLILEVNQRMDWINYIGTVSLLVNFTAQWIFFQWGYGVLSLAGGALAGTVVGVTLQAMVCHRLQLFPGKGEWGKVSWNCFRELSGYGRDVFLVVVGTQLISTSQVFVITPLLGLEAAAAWAIGLRVYTLLSQAVGRIFDATYPMLGEMMVRGERARLCDRFRNLCVLSFSLAAWVGGGVAACNSQFVTIWMQGKVHWPHLNDWLLALWLITTTIARCNANFVLLTKQIGFLRYVYFLEGGLFVGLACLVARWGGLAAIIGCSVFCGICLTGAYSLTRTSRYFNLSIVEVAWGWLRQTVVMLAFYVPVVAVIAWLPVPGPKPVRLGCDMFLIVAIGGFLFLRYGLLPSFQGELVERAPARVRPFLQRMLIKGS